MTSLSTSSATSILLSNPGMRASSRLFGFEHEVVSGDTAKRKNTTSNLLIGEAKITNES